MQSSFYVCDKMADTKSIDVKCPAVVWAQRRDRLFITIQLDDARDCDIDINESRLKFSGIGGPEEKKYAITIEFHKEVNPDESKKHLNPRKLFFEIKKKEEGEYWPRLTSGAKKEHWLKTDFNRWIDEDEEVEESGTGAGDGAGMDLQQMMQNMGGMPNMNGAEEDDDGPDSDDEELPDLE